MKSYRDVFVGIRRKSRIKNDLSVSLQRKNPINFLFRFDNREDFSRFYSCIDYQWILSSKTTMIVE